MIIIKTEPVAWSGKKVLKYQAVATLCHGTRRIKNIYGNPMPTKDAALEALHRECLILQEATSESLTEIKRRQNNGV